MWYLDMLPWLFITLAALLVQFFFILFFYTRLVFFKNDITESHHKYPVSVVIAARNEAENLKKNLPAILSQDYYDYEVIVVDDGSEDDTEDVLAGLKLEYPRLRSLQLKQQLNFFTGKKFPLSLGIHAASHEHLLLTDADCVAQSDQWIRSVMDQYCDSTSVVLAYGPYKPKASLLNLLIRWETLQTAMNYFSFALAGLPYMGVGRNLSYRKSLFHQSKGFTSHYKIPSGDDDLFINQVAKASNTRICLKPESFMYSEPKSSFAAWYRQKRRHLSTSHHYRFKFKFLLVLQAMSVPVFYLGLLGGVLATPYLWPVYAGILIWRLIIWMMVVKLSMHKLREHQLLLFSPLGEILLLFFQLIIGIHNVLQPPKKWK